MFKDNVNEGRGNVLQRDEAILPALKMDFFWTLGERGGLVEAQSH